MNRTQASADILNHQSAITHAGRPLLRLISGLFSHPTSATGTTLCTVFLVLALFGPHIAPYDANEQIATAARSAPSSAHWFGTDNLGRDVFSRIVLGAREVLFLAGSGTLLAVLTGTALGLLSGYWGGWFDEVIMRLFDSLLAIPALLLALLLVGVLGPSDHRAVLVILLVYTPIVARVVRSVILGIKNRAFVEAARLQGESLGRILFREILPSVLPVLAVEAALRFSYAIFLVASLGFLGVGVQPPSPNWGLMVKEARTYATQLPWSLYFPAGAISLLVIGVNLMADGLRRELLISEQEVV
jgi:peptide/nickel transport system permease protein